MGRVPYQHFSCGRCLDVMILGMWGLVTTLILLNIQTQNMATSLTFGKHKMGYDLVTDVTYDLARYISYELALPNGHYESVDCIESAIYPDKIPDQLRPIFDVILSVTFFMFVFLDFEFLFSFF